VHLRIAAVAQNHFLFHAGGGGHSTTSTIRSPLFPLVVAATTSVASAVAAARAQPRRAHLVLLLLLLLLQHVLGEGALVAHHAAALLDQVVQVRAVPAAGRVSVQDAAAELDPLFARHILHVTWILKREKIHFCKNSTTGDKKYRNSLNQTMQKVFKQRKNI
jgi:hypothetical protein